MKKSWRFTKAQQETVNKHLSLQACPNSEISQDLENGEGKNSLRERDTTMRGRR